MVVIALRLRRKDGAITSRTHCLYRVNAVPLRYDTDAAIWPHVAARLLTAVAAGYMAGAGTLCSMCKFNNIFGNNKINHTFFIIKCYFLYDMPRRYEKNYYLCGAYRLTHIGDTGQVVGNDV